MVSYIDVRMEVKVVCMHNVFLLNMDIQSLKAGGFLKSYGNVAYQFGISSLNLLHNPG